MKSINTEESKEIQQYRRKKQAQNNNYPKAILVTQTFLLKMYKYTYAVIFIIRFVHSGFKW